MTHNAQRIMQKPADLNDAQWRSVQHDGGHLLIVAGPGTGKTHTLTRRIVQLISSLNNDEHILAITFTNKAAGEMQERLKALLTDAQTSVTVGTFHGFCLQLLRKYLRHTNLPEHFRVASPEEIETLVKSQWEIPVKELRSILEEISRWKSFSSNQAKPSRLKEYNDLLRSRGLVDFDDLMNDTLILLTNNEKVAGEIRRKYRFICVDEYQDLNAIQNAFLKEMVKEGVYLTAIGDPNQAIYGFRGSDPRFFNQFDRDFPQATITMLRENYRSTENILAASSQVIGSGKNQLSSLDAIANIHRQGRLTVHESATDKSEAEYVVSQIENLVGGTSMFSRDSGRVKDSTAKQFSFGDIAVLYRLNAQKNSLKQALERSGIPFQICGDQGLSLSLEVIDAVRQFSRQSSDGKVPDVLKAFAQSGQGRSFLESNDRLAADWERIVNCSRKAGSLEAFFDQIALQKPEDHFEFHIERVSLMTLHASKGLEFSVVFIVGCEENILPMEIAGLQSDVDEERRLFYVGMTRAKEYLYVTRAFKRSLFGQALNNAPSRFLADIQEDLKAYEQMQQRARRETSKEDDRQMTLF